MSNGENGKQTHNNVICKKKKKKEYAAAASFANAIQCDRGCCKRLWPVNNNNDVYLCMAKNKHQVFIFMHKQNAGKKERRKNDLLEPFFG